jgi:diguanylate cyclase (GGDEF)-like protein
VASPHRYRRRVSPWRLATLLAVAAVAAAAPEPMTLDAFRILSVEEPQRCLRTGEDLLAGEWAASHPKWRRDVVLRMARAATLLADATAVDRAVARLEALAAGGDEVAGAYAGVVRGASLADAGRVADALETATAAAAVLRATGDERLRAFAESEMCDVAARATRVDLARRHCSEARRLWEPLGDSYQLGRIDNYLAMIADENGDVEEAIRLGKRARDLFVRAGMPSLGSMMDDNLAGYYLDAGQPAQALALSTSALRHEEASGKVQHAVLSRMNIAHALALLGRHAAAKEAIARAIADARKIGYDVALPSLYEVQIVVGKAAGDNQLVHQAAAGAVAAINALAKSERERALFEAEASFGTAIAEAEAKRARTRSALLAVSGGSFAVIAVLLLLLLRAGHRRERELAMLSSTDSLTGAATRRAFMTALDQAVAIGSTGPAPVLLVLDADHFKRLNDEHGHPAGDEALRQLVARVRSEIRAADVVGRLGGEEFGVVLRGAGGDEAARRAEAIRAAVAARPLELGESHVTLTVSIGVAVLDGKRIPSVERWLAAADGALYEAKRGGRNRVAVAS